MVDELLYNDFADVYEALEVEAYRDLPSEVDRIRNFATTYVDVRTQPSSKLLDVGCGTGNHISKLTNTFSCVGVDVNRGVLKRAVLNAPEASFFQSDMASLPISGNFSVILCLASTINYIQNCDELPSVFEEFYSALEPGGVLLLEHAPYDQSLVEDGTSGVDILRTTTDGTTITAHQHYDICDNNLQMDITYVLKQNNTTVERATDTHVLSLFESSTVRDTLTTVGFTIEAVEKGENRVFFVAKRPDM